jgi:hypothetical protein
MVVLVRILAKQMGLLVKVTPDVWGEVCWQKMGVKWQEEKILALKLSEAQVNSCGLPVQMRLKTWDLSAVVMSIVFLVNSQEFVEASCVSY